MQGADSAEYGDAMVAALGIDAEADNIERARGGEGAGSTTASCARPASMG
jgi:hypothetical protein